MLKFATKAIHEGYKPDAETGAIMPPIYMTSTYVQDAPGESRGYEYTRAHNPNFTISRTCWPLWKKLPMPQYSLPDSAPSLGSSADSALGIKYWP